MATGFDFSDIFDEAVDRSGGEQSTASDVIKVRRGLRLLLERWEAQGFNTWRIRTKNILLSAGTPRVALGDDVDDVINVGAVRGCDKPGATEMPMDRISAANYAQIANKLSDGQPSQYWLDRQDNPALMVYPVPDCHDAHGLVVTYVERPAEYNRYAASADDVPGRWLEALITGLALDLARKRPPYDNALISRLKSEAAEAEDLAQRADRDRGRFRVRQSGRRRG